MTTQIHEAVQEYINARNERVKKNYHDHKLDLATYQFTHHLIRTNFTKNFTWMGVPILQYPTDLMVMQEIIFNIKPDFIIETGTAFGGTALFYASMLKLIGRKGLVITIDIEHRQHTKDLITSNPAHDRIIMVELDSTNPKVMVGLRTTFDLHESSSGKKPTAIVCLDSNHTTEHVLAEMELYSQFVSVGSYMVVFDTAIRYYMHSQPADRPWGPESNPGLAVDKFMEKHEGEFVIDTDKQAQVVITAAPWGWLKRVK